VVLRECAGAADQHTGALLVNPYDIDAVADVIEHALELSSEERTARMRHLRRRVRANTVHHWVNAFVDELVRRRNGASAGTSLVLDNRVAPLAQELTVAKPLVLLLDYDGTLVGLAPSPELAPPDPALMELLARLAAVPGYVVHLVSGRPREELDRWLGGLPIHLWAEHGFWRRRAGTSTWHAAFEPDVSWKPAVRDLVSAITRDTVGSKMEEKGASIAWHYRGSDPAAGRAHAAFLQEQIRVLFPGGEVEAMHGAKVVEIRPRGMNKGLVPRVLSDEEPLTAQFVAIGDDVTDEAMFAALPESGLAIQVGIGGSPTRHRLTGPTTVRRFLAALVEAASH
jgi:trehalose 6-phosphate synthase/phosphatase